MSKRRFILSLTITSKEEEVQFVKRLDSLSISWWHWLPNTWLLIDLSGYHTVEGLTQIVRTIFPNTFFLIIEHPGGGTWMGYGPDEQKPKESMFKWIRETWT